MDAADAVTEMAAQARLLGGGRGPSGYLPRNGFEWKHLPNFRVAKWPLVGEQL